MSWHHFKSGEKYSKEDIINTVEKHLESGKVAEPERKRKYLEIIRTSNEENLIFNPTNGWGASPINPASWTTPNGIPISNGGGIPKNKS